MDNSSESGDPFKAFGLPDLPPNTHDGLRSTSTTLVADGGELPAAELSLTSSRFASPSTLHQRPPLPTPPLQSSTSPLGEDRLGGSSSLATSPPEAVPLVAVAMTSSSLALPPATGKRRARTRVAPASSPSAELPPTTTTTSKRQSKQRVPPTEMEALELRRKYNRESMQRTRAREREEVERMRAVLAELELEYKRAVSLQAQQVRDPMRAEYRALSSATKQLMQENFRMRQDLEHRRKSYERVERILADYHAEKADISMESAMLIDEEKVGDSASAAFGIPLITEAEASALMAKCSQQTIESLERYACKSPTTPPLRSDAPFFGWDVRRRIDDGISSSSVHFLFTKSFPNLSAARAANCAWEVYGYLERNNVKPIRVVRFDTLQVVNENTRVIARDIIHPRHEGAVLRSIFLRFRMETEKGFVIGRSCMNPVSARSWSGTSGRDSDSSVIGSHGSSSSNRIGVRYADLSTWLEVNYLDPSRRDVAGCEVKFGGVSDYGTTHDLNARFMDVLFSVLQMENRVLEPLVSLPK